MKQIRPELLCARPPGEPIEYYRLPKSGGRDPHFGFSRSWYYKAAASGEIQLVSIRQRNALRGVRLIVYDSVVDFIRRSISEQISNGPRAAAQTSASQEPLADATDGDS
ncbi:MAG: hypothetical protein JWM35_417 [Verrucomicrobia bacterium]|nr:hypothetical protein [Verrucomicrobiota bacterium]